MGGTLILPLTSKALSCSSDPLKPQAHFCPRLGEEWWVLQPVSQMGPKDLGLFGGLSVSNQLGCMMVGYGGRDSEARGKNHFGFDLGLASLVLREARHQTVRTLAQPCGETPVERKRALLPTPACEGTTLEVDPPGPAEASGDCSLMSSSEPELPQWLPNSLPPETVTQIISNHYMLGHLVSPLMLGIGLEEFPAIPPTPAVLTPTQYGKRERRRGPGSSQNQTAVSRNYYFSILINTLQSTKYTVFFGGH